MLNELVLSSPGRVFLSIGGYDIYNYGVVIALAILAGVYTSAFLSDKSNVLPKNIFIDISPMLIISGILGARLWYCILNYQVYITEPLEILNLRTGGISIHGALLAGIVYLLIYSAQKKINIKTLCDYAAPGLILGQSIGRWGNFFNNEAFGLPYDGLLKLYIPPSDRPYIFADYSYFHPAFLYESIADIVLFFVLLFILKTSGKKYPGLTALSYLLGYSAIRFCVELIRIDASVHIFRLPFPAFISLIIFILSAVVLIFSLIKIYK